MGVVSVNVPSSGGYTPRTQVSGNQWTEVNVPSAGSSVPDELRVGSEFDEIIVVKTWDPIDDEAGVEHGQSVIVNLEANNSEELEILYDEGQDFTDGGTVDQVEIVGDLIQLKTDSPDIDFDDYLYATLLVDSGQPDDWYKMDQSDDYVKIYDNPDEDGQCVRYEGGSAFLSRRFDEGGQHWGGTVKCKIKFDSEGDMKHVIFFQTTGGGTGQRGFAGQLIANSTNFSFHKCHDWDSWSTIYNSSHGIDLQDHLWYWFKLQFWSNVEETETYCQYKVWVDGDAEPGSWNWGGGDGTYTREGYVGHGVIYPSGWYYNRMDDFSFVPSPATYYTDGDWQSDIIDVTAAEGYSHALVTWDEVTPTDTTVAVKARWPNGSWLACTNDGELPGIDYSEKMVAGSGHDELELKIELATTDINATPTIENLRVYHEPINEAELELIVDAVPCTIANGLMFVWGRGWIGSSGNPPTIEADWSNISARAALNWIGANREVIAATLKYASITIEGITFEAAPEPRYRQGYLRSYFTMPITPFYTGVNLYEWTALKPWDPGGKIYSWVLTDKGFAIHADARWLVGHAKTNDHPLSFLISEVNLTDHPLSVQVRGYQRDDHLMSMLVQGWQRDDFPLSVQVGVWTINDQPVSMLAAIEYLDDHPLSIVVYGVSREGMIEVNIIDDDTWAELVALGYTRS